VPATPEAQQIIDAIGAAGPPPNTKEPAEVRQGASPADAMRQVLEERGTPYEPEPVAGIAERVIPGPGGEIPVRVYTPQGEGPFPVLVYYHGGGWVLFDLDVYDASCRGLANAGGCVVLSVDYRQAPEHPYPAAHEDTFAAYAWARSHAPEIGGDPDRVAVAGESVGGNMAASTCLMAREQGMPMPLFQILVYPVTNYAFDTPSYQSQAEAVPLSRDLMQWFFRYYLRDESDGADPRLSVLRADDLSGLPPALVITAEIDPLHSEGEAYTGKLRAAEVPVEYRHYPGVMHEFFSMPAAILEARRAIDEAGAILRSAWAVGGSPSGVNGSAAPAEDGEVVVRPSDA